uniref:Uncharacterized protein n=2 Tax=Aureoumbra lagunensis TaxID=44058 RepID=A0A6S8C5R6_9STRA|mmetsp:Transcript_21081/g.27323  ORF Transcript_21081/g.27323 Transcript_21081/m.27323 type:complete len:695 (+) Transcript_21081:35-2119(+)|eukprot:CAMPEP_0197309072 /NCGR_PEP_ID=MMETSP0891-20130614/7626_1 /TAXON_ID=44058 ORGANISM="Aureoumbra lagunensis, Strain CCMP1510" /NCGR_SAMPLE_ID=MMETSP0891 /ASSEMBLY_ACC=CAM_ASM_000534 /LENGTH=694 /DNA_ID=CAMNT_0042793949 /DNA_START=35 /DNA_END=2119 /DNA_ORIENTATION=+
MSGRPPPPSGPPVRGPPPRAPPPRHPPPSMAMPPNSISAGRGAAVPRMPPPRSLPPRAAPPGRGPPPRPMPGQPGQRPPMPRGPPPRGPPPRQPPRMAMPGQPRPRAPPGQPPGPRGPPPSGPPPRIARGAPPRGPPPRGPPPRIRPGAARPPGLVPAIRAPPSGPPIGQPLGMVPRGAPPRGPMPRGPRPRPAPPPPTGSALVPAPPQAPALPKFGSLQVNLLRAVGLKAGQSMYGKADPYTKLTVGTQVFSSNPHIGGGKDPIWNAEHVFEISTEKEMLVEIFDKETVGSDKFMGQANVNIVDWIAAGSFKGDLELRDKSDRPVGRLQMAATFSRPGDKDASDNNKAIVPMSPDSPLGSPGSIATPPNNAKKARLNQVVPIMDGPTSPNTKSAAPGEIQYNKDEEARRDPAGKFTDEEIWEAFTAFDLDKNNFVGAAEIRHVLINIGEQVTDDEVDEMIRMIDRDGDGQVSFPEFFDMVTGGRQPPPGLGNSASNVNVAGVKGVKNTTAGAQPPTGQSVVAARNAKKSALDDFARDCNLKPESIKKSYKRFQATDKDKSGMIDYTEFCEILQVDPSPQGERLFQLFDYDRSGQIDVREFMIALSNFTGATKDDKLKFAFMIFDEDGNGVITKGELTRILRANHMASSDAEVARKAETIMQQADKDGDGVVTFDEFVIVSKKFPNILFPAMSK